MKLKDLTVKQISSLVYLLVAILVLVYLLLFTDRSNSWVAVGLFTLQAAILVYLNVFDSTDSSESPDN